MSNISVVHFLGTSSDTKCGHCKSDEGKVASDMVALRMNVEDYQSLLNRNWARAGRFCFLPQTRTSCCTKYTIMCDAVNFRISRSQRRVIRGFNKYLCGGDHLVDTKKKDCEGEKLNKKAQNPSKKKFARVERRRAKGLPLRRRYVNSEKSLEQLLAEAPQDGAHKLETRLVRSTAATSDDSFELFTKYQTRIHGFKHEELTKVAFERAFFASPLQHRRDATTPPDGLGSFHLQYFLDNRLIAVSVLDVLPECVSSVYCFYDPDLSFLNVGIFTALYEIAMVRELHLSCASIRNYNIGYFVPTCKKVRYMTRFRPSFLLCSEAFTWHSLDEQLLREIDSMKYMRISGIGGYDQDSVTEDDVNDVLVLYNHRPARYGELKKVTMGVDRKVVLEYATKVGRRLSRKMLLLRPV
jgi:arginine-tRNA-protein transferase